jgi:glycosyltransferase involved in cell wall biosynthesis
MKVAWVSVYNIEALSAYGGRGYYQPQSLNGQEDIDLNYISPLKIPILYKALIKLKRDFIYRNRYLPISRKTYDPLMESFVLKSYARQISKRLSKLNNIDIVFSGLCQYLQPITYLDCHQPIVTWTDAPLVSAIDFYPGMGSNEVASECLTKGIANDKGALRKASLAIYGSEWAAQIAISHYQLDPAKVKVVPLGPNISSSYNSTDIRAVINARPSDQCKLLFLGGDWTRKGGDTAAQIAYKLNQSGLKTELAVVGCSPHLDVSLAPYVKCLGYISNASQEGIAQLQDLLAKTHFLLLPTLADACPHVVSEANSFGVPSLTTDVGGLPTLVKDDLNGKKFAKNATIEEYCTYIFDLFSDYSRYKDLALSSFHEYETRLSWSVAGRTIKKLLTELIA